MSKASRWLALIAAVAMGGAAQAQGRPGCGPKMSSESRPPNSLQGSPVQSYQLMYQQQAYQQQLFQTRMLQAQQLLAQQQQAQMFQQLVAQEQLNQARPRGEAASPPRQEVKADRGGEPSPATAPRLQYPLNRRGGRAV